MALFKVSKGLNTNLPETLTEGYCWYTYNDSKFYIDFKDEKGVLSRKALNAQEAEKLIGYDVVTILRSSEVEIPTSKAVIDAIDTLSTSIVDVTTLPTTDINENSTYRTINGIFVSNGLLRHDSKCYTVEWDGAPSEAGESVLLQNSDGDLAFVGYYNVKNNVLYGYFDTNTIEMLKVMVDNSDLNSILKGLAKATLSSMSTGWKTMQEIVELAGTYSSISWGGIIDSINDATDEDSVYLLLESEMFFYRHGAWVQLYSGLGNYGTGSGAEVFNSPTNTASGKASHAEGMNTTASGANSHSEGSGTTAGGLNSHAEGLDSIAEGDTSHAEGANGVANGYAAHVEGTENTASSDASHAEGTNNTIAVGATAAHVEGDSNNIESTGVSGHAEGHGVTVSGYAAHAEGINTVSSGEDSHAEGSNATASGPHSHAEGYGTEASNSQSHAEGANTKATGFSSHAEGTNSVAAAENSHAEGLNGVIADTANGGHVEGIDNTVEGIAAHAEGNNTKASALASHSEGQNTTASGQSSHAEGINNTASAYASHVEGSGNTTDGQSSHAEGSGNTIANTGTSGHAEGINNKVEATAAHAEGQGTTSSGYASHTEGINTIASAEDAHAEGLSSRATNSHAHAEGYNTEASGNSAHSEGGNTVASGSQSHAEGVNTKAIGSSSHAEGSNTEASGFVAHTEGQNTIASGGYSHAEGKGTIANKDGQHVQGQYNETVDNAAFIIGNGSHEGNRSNAHTIDWSGNAWFSGGVKVGGAGHDDTDAKVLATEEYVRNQISTMSTNSIIVDCVYSSENDKAVYYSTNKTFNEVMSAYVAGASAYFHVGSSYIAISTYTSNSTASTLIGFDWDNLKIYQWVHVSIGATVLSSFDMQATTTEHGFMSSADKIKLDNIDEGANKTIVDDSISSDSINPVQNKAVKEYVDAKVAPLLPRATTVSLSADAWVATNNFWSQVVTINGVTPNSKIDLQPSIEQLITLQNEGTSLVASNNDGIVTVYAFNYKPSVDFNMQALIIEVISV